MDAEHRILRLFVRASRPLPLWMKTRRASMVAGAGVAFFVFSIVSDFGGFLDMVVPGRKPADQKSIAELGKKTVEKIDESASDTGEKIAEATSATVAEINNLKETLLAQLRRNGAFVEAPVESALDEALNFFMGLGDGRVDEAVRLMGSAPPARALSLFKAVALDFANENEADAAEAWRALGALAYPVDGAAALDAYERARNLDANDAYTHIQLGVLYQDLARLAEAQAANEKAIELARRGGEIDLAALARMQNGGVLKQRGKIAEAEKAFREAADDFLKLDDRYSLAIVYSNLGSLFGLDFAATAGIAADLQASEDYYVAARNIGYELRNAELVANGDAGLGDVWHKRGNSFLAIELYSRALAYYEWSNMPERIAQMRLSLGLVALVLRDVERAKSDFSEAMRIFSGLNLPLQVAVAKIEFALAYAMENDAARACRELQEAGATFREAGVNAYLQQIDGFMAEVCAADGPSGGAVQWALDEAGGANADPGSFGALDLFANFDELATPSVDSESGEVSEPTRAQEDDGADLARAAGRTE